MKLSIIIPTYNEEEVLPDAIESLGFQTYDDFEIIVVDDGSTDKTLEILRNLQLTIPNFHFLEQKHKGAGAARNLGAKSAKGAILVFVDADMAFDKEFLAKLVEPIEQYKKGLPAGRQGTFSKEEIVSNWKNVWARCWNINEGWEDRRRHPKNYPDHQPVFRAILKSEFDRVGGFTPGGYNDDWSLGKKLGYDAVAAPGAVFYHRNPGSLGEVFKHARWVGKRKYKLGIIGDFIAMLRVILPFSIIIGLIKGIIHKEIRFAIFKIVYDFGVFIGILQYMYSGKGAK